MTSQDDNQLGNYLRERRQRLDAAKLGYTLLRRRTPGLRREEVAVRAGIRGWSRAEAARHRKKYWNA